MRKEIWLVPPILILILYFAYRLVDQSQMLSIFPLDYTNDWASYISQLFFLKECGFHNYCPYWFNGFTSFILTPPGWFYFALPLYYLFGNVLHASFFSLLMIFLIGAVTFFYFGKYLGLTKIQILIFFSLVFMNANTIGTYVRQGRIAEFFAFMLLFILIFSVLWYKDKKFDKKFLLLPLLLAAIILSNQSVAVLAIIMMFCLFLASDLKRKTIIALSVALSLILTVFWWAPFIKNFSASWGAHLKSAFTGYLLVFSKDSIFINLGLTLSALFFMIFVLYCKKTGAITKRDFLFLSPIIILAILAIFKIVAFVPPFTYVYPDVYSLFFLFWGLFLMFKSNLAKNTRLLAAILLLVCLASVMISHYHTPYFENYNEVQEDVLDIFPYVHEKFFFLSAPNEKIYSKILYAYAPVYYNLSTPCGYHSSMNYNLYGELNSLNGYLQNGSCIEILGILEKHDVKELVSLEPDCETLELCGMTRARTSGKACLLHLTN